ncbi:hypothetical protein [Christiangramia flava]|uniref:Uncharacterized protein n=1 Tax=Christiangramia flava JLT2011 TaxID=1229726 RepID=A0A1L7HZG3_9FLAO|nr:hypothetical protein [Christiangramia flava]APU66730.1 hypothetical protein GRFL_0006 [Christiangramia flava JLT2011]OSS38368.1 hypothetical protein C723_2605 [Christiangramia flava JLT2011]
MKKIALLILLFVGGGLMAQNTVAFASARGMRIFTKEKEPDTFTGTPYFEKDFVLGTIHDEQGRSQPAFLRYNAVEDVVVVKLDKLEKDSYMLPKLSKISYELPGYTYYIDQIDTEDGIKESYFASYFKGNKSQFIGIPKVDIINPQKAATGYEKDKPAHIDVEMEYYISIDGGKFKETRLKEKDLEDFFKSDKMEEYFDEHKIKDEKDVVEMLKFYES